MSRTPPSSPSRPPTPLKRYTTDPPCQESAGFRPKAPQQMLCSVEDMARCQAVCRHNRERVAALIKLFIHIIIRVAFKQVKLNYSELGTSARWVPGGPSGAAQMSSQPDHGCL